MPSTTRTDGPRHMAGRPHRSAGSRAASGAAPRAVAVDLEVEETAPPARVPRHRLAFALAVTVAALPIVALDNFAATAQASSEVEMSADAVEATRGPETTTTSAAPTTAPPTTVAAPTPTEAPTTTAAPTTTTAPAPVRVAAPKPAPTTTAAPAPPPPKAYGDPNDPATWDRMAQCEAGGNWAANTGNGYYGGLQFSLATWQSYGGTGYPHQASRETQIEIGKRLQADRGWGAWPGCAEELGYT